jgi:hypothetical protein
MPQSTSIESGASVGLSLFFVGAWIYWYWFKRVIIAHAFPIVFIVLAGVEVLGPLTHLIPQIEAMPAGWRISLICFLLLTALLLLVHHHRLRIRCDRHEALLGSLDVLLGVENRRPASGYSDAMRIQSIGRILDALVFALEFPRNQEMLLNATVLIREEPGSPFRITYQDSRYFFPPDEFALHPTECVAGNVSLEKADCLIYVPSTRFRHGVRLSGGDSVNVVAGAFQQLEGLPGQTELKCLLCVKVPKGNKRARGAKRRDAVLCLSGQKSDCMTALHFSAIRVVAALVSFVLEG